jgi:uncharacterized lipoprotein YddW (UPF0748 family)
MRGVWVATAKNLDYPRKPTNWPVAQKEEWKNLLETYRELGFNAVFFQVRSAGDAFYPSALAPWSANLTGEQDRPPRPEYDVLQFLIEEAHRQGLEFHAWINPFRATMNLNTDKLSLRHVYHQHPRWVERYGSQYFLNPGLPEVREHLYEVIAEIVGNYDVDGIHLDDYFYPYPLPQRSFPDTAAYRLYGQEFSSVEDWRRENVNQFIAMANKTIKERKPHVYFGLSPFGVWRNQNMDRIGSETQADLTAYDDLYADVLKWVQMGWIDYMVPQLFWHIGFEPADHAALQRWWSLHKGSVELYTGHAAYKLLNDREEAWQKADELNKQIDLSRRNRRISGHVLFSSSAVLADPLDFKDSLRQLYIKKALLPERPSLELRTHAAPELKVKNKGGDALIKLTPNKADEARPPHYYVIYRFEGARMGRMEEAASIFHISPPDIDGDGITIVDQKVGQRQVYTYVATAVNRAHQESRPSEPFSIREKKGRIRKY